MVPEQTRQVEEAREVLGPEQCDGRVWAVWGNGPALHPPPRIHPEICQGWNHGILRPVAAGDAQKVSGGGSRWRAAARAGGAGPAQPARSQREGGEGARATDSHLRGGTEREQHCSPACESPGAQRQGPGECSEEAGGAGGGRGADTEMQFLGAGGAAGLSRKDLNLYRAAPQCSGTALCTPKLSRRRLPAHLCSSGMGDMEQGLALSDTPVLWGHKLGKSLTDRHYLTLRALALPTSVGGNGLVCHNFEGSHSQC
ncbi:hypothetical protein FKM82_025553 [Ascaphus truei]